jgi:hypothetical protein
MLQHMEQHQAAHTQQQFFYCSQASVVQFKASICPAIIATPFPLLYPPPTVNAINELPFLETK